MRRLYENLDVVEGILTAHAAQAITVMGGMEAFCPRATLACDWTGFQETWHRLFDK